MNTFFLFLVLIGTTSSAEPSKKIIGYLSSSILDNNETDFFNYVDPNLFTHLIYAFAGLSDNGSIVVSNPYVDLPDGLNGYGRFNDLRKINPNLKTLISFGGWNAQFTKYSTVFEDSEKRAYFIQTALDLVLQYDFNGLDIDWEFPNIFLNTSQDITAFTSLLKGLKEAFEPYGLILSAALEANPLAAKTYYEIDKIHQYLDILNVMTYEFHEPGQGIADFNSPVYARDNEFIIYRKNSNINASIDYWLSFGADPEKVVIGVPYFGHTYKLLNPNHFQPGAISTGSGSYGGSVNYVQICSLSSNWTLYWQEEQLVPYVVHENEWWSIENVDSVKAKAQFVLDNNIGGAMIWSIESDDYLGLCGETNILTKTLYKTLND